MLTRRILMLRDSIAPGPRILGAGIWVGTKGGVCEFTGIGIAGGADAFVQRVRMIGYMVQQEPLPTSSFLLAPLPVQISDEDEPLADDLPPSTVSVIVPGAETKSIRSLPGLIQITGVLHVGAHGWRPNGRAGDGRAGGGQIASGFREIALRPARATGNGRRLVT